MKKHNILQQTCYNIIVRKLTLLMCILSLYSILSCEKPQNFSIKGKTYNFVLMNKDKSVSLKDYEKRYKVILLYFGYTHCPDVCPTVLHKLSVMYNDLGSYKKYVKVIFITLDPKRDTPDIADTYAKFFNKDFTGLSGTQDAIEKTAKAYGVLYKIVPSKSEGYLIDHSDNIYLIYNKSLETIFQDKDQNPMYMASYIKKLLNK